MILETIPAIQQLTPQQRLILAAELMGDYQEQPTAELDESIGHLIEARMQHYREHPGSARTWEEIQSSIGKA